GRTKNLPRVHVGPKPRVEVPDQVATLMIRSEDGPVARRVFDDAHAFGGKPKRGGLVEPRFPSRRGARDEEQCGQRGATDPAMHAVRGRPTQRGCPTQPVKESKAAD